MKRNPIFKIIIAIAIVFAGIETGYFLYSYQDLPIAVPDFGRYIYTKGLDSVKPGSVNIIRRSGT